jgi:hypothetical protein
MGASERRWRDRPATALVIYDGASPVSFMRDGEDAQGRALWSEAESTISGAPRRVIGESLTAEDLLDGLRGPLGATSRP